MKDVLLEESNGRGVMVKSFREAMRLSRWNVVKDKNGV
jgi:hypothetical protein